MRETTQEQERIEKIYAEALKPVKPGQCPVVAGAGNIRRILKKAFPLVKFKVRSEKYSMGCSINIFWTKGPTCEEVDALVKSFVTTSFDGMIDLKSYIDTDFHEKFGGADHVSTYREIPHEEYKAVEKALEGISIPGLPDYTTAWFVIGKYYIPNEAILTGAFWNGEIDDYDLTWEVK